MGARCMQAAWAAASPCDAVCGCTAHLVAQAAASQCAARAMLPARSTPWHSLCCGSSRPSLQRREQQSAGLQQGFPPTTRTRCTTLHSTPSTHQPHPSRAPWGVWAMPHRCPA